MPQLMVDRLALRMPGTDSAHAKRLAVLVAERLAVHQLTLSGDIGRIEIRVPWPDGTSDARLADAICEAIIQTMHRVT